jgi:hypothetical protein
MLGKSLLTLLFAIIAAVLLLATPADASKGPIITHKVRADVCQVHLRRNRANAQTPRSSSISNMEASL